MSRKTLITLLTLTFLSLLVSFGVGWALQKANRTGWLVRPSLLTPYWEREPEHPRAFEPRLLPQARFLTRFSPWWVVGRTVASEIFFFLMGVLALFLFPQRFSRMLETSQRKALSYLGIGVITALLAILIGGLTLLSLAGLLFLPYLLFLFGLVTILGLLVSFGSLGGLLRTRLQLPEHSPLIDLVLGIGAFFIVGNIPILGTLAFLLATLWGWGAIVATRFGASESWLFLPE